MVFVSKVMCLGLSVTSTMQGYRHNHIHTYIGTERTAPSKTTDRLSLVSLLMSVESNSGAAGARATVTWPSAEVAVGLNPLEPTYLCTHRHK